MSTTQTSRKRTSQSKESSAVQAAKSQTATRQGKAAKPKTMRAAAGEEKSAPSVRRARKRVDGESNVQAAPTQPTPAQAAQTILQDGAVVNAESWQRMVAEAAYFRAERRGFANGTPEQDWLEAEEEVRRMWSEQRA
ncbi:MAG TPA: DUF2934 domain-containing protein [Burkholderiales bacterium]|nr:DUF2934 domain-containing protein [Burkholderiales bacterium]